MRNTCCVFFLRNTQYEIRFTFKCNLPLPLQGGDYFLKHAKGQR